MMRRELEKLRKLQRQEEHRMKWAEQNGDDSEAVRHEDRAASIEEKIENVRNGKVKVKRGTR